MFYHEIHSHHKGVISVIKVTQVIRVIGMIGVIGIGDQLMQDIYHVLRSGQMVTVLL